MPVFEIVFVGPGNDPVPELLHDIVFDDVPVEGENIEVGERTLTVRRVEEFEPDAVRGPDGMILAVAA